jgi:hypothetical protein
MSILEIAIVIGLGAVAAFFWIALMRTSTRGG